MEITDPTPSIPSQRSAEYSVETQTEQRVSSTNTQKIAAKVQTTQEDSTDSTEAALKGLEKTLDKVNQVFEASSTAIRFEINQEVDRVVIKIVNPETKELVRQIPSEEALKISKNLTQYLEKTQTNGKQTAEKTAEPGLILDNNA